jgi:hypothetical protein
MPTKVKEYSMYKPGSLVRCVQAIYSSGPSIRIAAGTVGTILKGPHKGYEDHCQVHFVAVSEPWWVGYDEIEPYY